MPIDRFDRARFEAALPHDKETGKPLCKHVGLVHGQHVYWLPIDDVTGVVIYSSIGSDDLARECAKDSIRLVISDDHGKPLAKKRDAYTTRVPGWEDRLKLKLRELWKLGHYVRWCPRCLIRGEKNRPRISKVKDKSKESFGKEFVRCWECGKYFEWVRV